MLATRGARLRAAILDGALHIVVTLVLMLVVVGHFESARFDVFGVRIGPAPFTLWITGETIFHAVQGLAIVRWSASLGKVLVGITVRRTDGGSASRLRLLVLRPAFVLLAVGVEAVNQRPSLRIPEVDPLLLPNAIGALLVLDVLCIFAEQRRCLHDYLAGTAVFTTRSLRAVEGRSAAAARPASE